jgi:DNA end-binding protein Ku
MRSFWKGSITFGLINIPVSLYTASKEHELKFTLLHRKDLSEIRYARICKAEDREVPYDQIVKGIEKGGRYVVMEEEDFKKARAEKSEAIEIVAFCESEDIESIYYEKPYFLKPEKQGIKAYFLLQQALEQTNKVAVVRYVLRNRVNVAAIKSFNHVLVLNQMRFHHQIVSVDELEIDTKIKVSAKEVEMATKLISQLSGKFEPEEFHDTYVEGLQKTISKKPKAGKVTPKEKVAKTAKIYDIMELLKASLDEKEKKPATPRAKGKARAS